MRVLKPDTKEEKLIFENTNFLTSHFFDKKIHFPFMWEVIQADPGIYVLKKSIEIIKSRQYSPPYFRNRVLFNNSNITHEFWKDPYWLHWYEERKNTIENLIQTERIDFKNNPYKDDILLSKNHSEEIEGTQVQLDELNKIIKLSNEYRTLINEVFPDLESEAANNETLKNERKKRIEEKRKQGEKPLYATKYTPDQLGKIFDGLVKMKITKEGDKGKFLSIFSGEKIDKVYWDSSIRGAKTALFDLMERLIGEQMKKTDLLNIFDTQLDNNNRNTIKNDGEVISKPTKLINSIFKGIE